MADTFAQVMRKIDSAPPVEKEFKNLAETVGDCLDDALKFIVWKEHVTYREVFNRVWYVYKSTVVRLRHTSPCFCVQKEGQPACLFCPLKESAKEEIETIKKQTRTIYVCQMSMWDEFGRFYIEK